MSPTKPGRGGDGADRHPREEFLQRFKISEEDFAKPIRDVAHRATGGFETEEVREFVRERLTR